jgi:pimeloyl-ACP methyl ester carboxylesterase
MPRHKNCASTRAASGARRLAARRGSGRSRFVDDDIVAVAHAAGAERFHLVGESFGGTASLHLAAPTGSPVLASACVSTAHCGASIQLVRQWREDLRTRGMKAWSDEMMDRRFPPDASPFVTLEISNQIRQHLPRCEFAVFPNARHGLPFSHARECAQGGPGFRAPPRASPRGLRFRQKPASRTFSTYQAPLQAQGRFFENTSMSSIYT